MAGMFSMLSNSHARLDVAGSQHFEDDRSSVGSRTPVMQRRAFATGPPSTSIGQCEQIPRRFRKQRCNEIHPLLRRSICTLILAAIFILGGVTILLIQAAINQHYEMSVVGLSFIAFGVFLLLCGILWYYWSRKQLRRIEEKLCEIRKTQLMKNQKCSKMFPHKPNCSKKMEIYDRASISAITWPARNNTLPANINQNAMPSPKPVCEITTPNGSRKKNFEFDDVFQENYQLQQTGVIDFQEKFPSEPEISTLTFATNSTPLLDPQDLEKPHRSHNDISSITDIEWKKRDWRPNVLKPSPTRGYSPLPLWSQELITTEL